MNRQPTFTIRLRRLDAVEGMPGLIRLSVHCSEGSRTPTQMGSLTDAALRGRLAHFDLHSANEVAALRKALAEDSGQASVIERWPELSSCLQFWLGFVGSQVRRIAWTCESCGKTEGDDIGGKVGESFLSRCLCGRIQKVTVSR